MLKKIIIMALTAILTITCLSVNSYAENYYTVYDEYGNAYIIPENTVLVVIRDQ